MAKLTKTQRQSIQSALNATNALIAYIERDNIAFCNVKELNIKVEQGPNDYRARDSHRSQHYIGRDNYEWDIDYVKELTPMDKGIGSPLVQRYDIKRSLEQLLEE
jgi:hypothetical protein